MTRFGVFLLGVGWSVGLALLPGASIGATAVVLGDSLSDAYGMPREAGWVARLDRRIGPEHRLIDGSISGDTSAGARTRVDDLLAEHSPDVLLVIIGGNDGLRGLSPQRLRENLSAIVEAGAAAGAQVLLMQVRLPPNLGPRYVDAFEAVYPALAEAHRLELLPFFLEPLVDRPGMLMDDGIHPTEQAQAALATFVEPYLLDALERVAPARGQSSDP
ncbi:arylesterase [Halomonas denitrificans]|nr:arylesterase [Halomonas denitrificans]